MLYAIAAVKMGDGVHQNTLIQWPRTSEQAGLIEVAFHIHGDNLMIILLRQVWS